MLDLAGEFDKATPEALRYTGPHSWYLDLPWEAISSVAVWFAYGFSGIAIIWASTILPMAYSKAVREEIMDSLPHIIRWAMTSGAIFAVARTGVLLVKSGA